MWLAFPRDRRPPWGPRRASARSPEAAGESRGWDRGCSRDSEWGRLEEGGEEGRGCGRRGGGGAAGDRAPRAAPAPSLGRDRQLLSNRQRPEIYLKRGKGEENKGGRGRRGEPGPERASREDPALRGHIQRSHLYTPRSMGRMDNICQLQTFLFPLPGEGGKGKGGAGGPGARGRLKDSALPAAATRKPKAQRPESPGIFLFLLSLLIIFYYSTAASERAAAPLPRRLPLLILSCERRGPGRPRRRRRTRSALAPSVAAAALEVGARPRPPRRSPAPLPAARHEGSSSLFPGCSPRLRVPHASPEALAVAAPSLRPCRSLRHPRTPLAPAAGLGSRRPHTRPSFRTPDTGFLSAPLLRAVQNEE